MTIPGLDVKVSQMLGPLPSLLAAPSIWYDAVLVPKRNPGGNASERVDARDGSPDARVSPTGTICQMTVEIRRGTDRFVDRSAGRRTLHAFSFGAHYDPDHVAFGPMVCHDDHLLGDGRGFEVHEHSGLVIVSYVVSGALRHSDPTGEATLGPGDVGVLHTGRSVEHSEIAVAPQTRFVQVWLADPAPGGEASYEVTVAPVTPVPGARFSAVHLEPGEMLTTPLAPKVHVFVARGALLRSSLAEPLHDGDAFLFTDEPSYDLVSGTEHRPPGVGLRSRRFVCGLTGTSHRHDSDESTSGQAITESTPGNRSTTAG